MIGIFDSGVGGLIIYQKIKEYLPTTPILYLSDHIHFPYGEKTTEEVVDFSDRISRFLIEKGCNLIVIACNTATITAIQHLRKKYTVPFIGIVPAVKPASQSINKGKIAVLVTPLSAKGKTYNSLLKRWNSEHVIHTYEMPDFASIVENRELENASTVQYLHSVFQSLQEQNYKTIVLGCTHFLYLKQFLEVHYPGVFQIVDPIVGVAKQTCRIYQTVVADDLSEKYSQDIFFTTSDTSVLRHYLTSYLKIFNPTIKDVSVEELA